MARAKSTARAEARRRNRLAQGLPAESDTATPAVDSSATTGRPPSGRVSIVSAFRQSFHSADIREDLSALPRLVPRSKSFWVPTLVTVVAVVATAVGRGQDAVSLALFQFFVVPPAVGGVFIAGFLAPRASWLVGGIIGLISAIGYAILGYTGSLPPIFAESFAAQPTLAVSSGLVISVGTGVLFASAAAWYRRFLQLSSPNRARQQAQAVRRGPDGRSRGGSQRPARR